MGTPTGDRDRRIEIQRAGPPTDDGYTRLPGAFARLWRGWAAVTYGSGREQRGGAQEAALQSATFKVLSNALTRGLKMSDRLCYPVRDADPSNWPVWDIQALADPDRLGEIWITATRKS